MRYLWAVAALAALLLASNVAPAQEYPWCAVQYDDDGEITTCGYVTLQQCRDTIWGVGGYCRQNPYFLGAPPHAPKPVKRKRQPS